MGLMTRLWQSEKAQPPPSKERRKELKRQAQGKDLHNPKHGFMASKNGHPPASQLYREKKELEKKVEALEKALEDAEASAHDPAVTYYKRMAAQAEEELAALRSAALMAMGALVALGKDKALDMVLTQLDNAIYPRVSEASRYRSNGHAEAEEADA